MQKPLILFSDNDVLKKLAVRQSHLHFIFLMSEDPELQV